MIRLALLCSLLIACGPSAVGTAGTTRISVTVRDQVNVDWGPQGEDAINFEDPRLTRVLAELAEVVGHPVDLYFNVSMMPRPTTSFFEGLFERELGRLPRDLAGMQRRHADALAFGTQRFTAIVFDYDGSLDRPEAEHDREAGTVTIRMNRGIPGSAMSVAFQRSYAEYLDERFGNKSADDVPLDELGMYLAWLDSRTNHGSTDLRANALLSGLTVWQRAADQPQVRFAATEWLAHEVRFFANLYHNHRDEIAGKSEQDPFSQAERLWGAWLMSNWTTLSDAQKYEVLDNMYLRRTGAGRQDNPYLRDIFPGVDLMRLSLSVVDRWMAAGHPSPSSVQREDHTGRLFQLIVCPPHDSDGRRFRRPSCDSDLYQWATIGPDTDDSRAKLFDEILQRQDALLTATLFANLKWRSNPETLTAWRFFESDDAQWGAATEVLAELVDYSRQDLNAELYDDAVRIWRSSPRKRGSVLFLLAAMSQGRARRMVAWDRFGRVFGGTIGRQEFTAFLQHGESAVMRSPLLWQARGRTALMPLLLPVLEPMMNDSDVAARHRGFPQNMLREVIDAAKESRDRAGLQTLTRFLEVQQRAHPSQERLLGSLIERARR